MTAVNIIKSLKKNSSVLVLMPSVEYQESIAAITKDLAKESVCYVTLNKTHDSLQEFFKKKKVKTNNIIFIDAISQSLKHTEAQTDSCYFVSSPAALTELSILIGKFVKHDFRYLVFDSISTLGIYEKKDVIAKFISNVVNKAKEGNTRSVFFAVGSKSDPVVKECLMFFDDVIEMK